MLYPTQAIAKLGARQLKGLIARLLPFRDGLAGRHVRAGLGGQRVASGRLCAVLEAPAVVSSLDDVAVVRQAIEHGGRHFGVAEHLRPIGEGEIGRDQERRFFVELADQMEQQLANWCAGCSTPASTSRGAPGVRGGLDARRRSRARRHPDLGKVRRRHRRMAGDGGLNARKRQPGARARTQ
jgi:hypothetical protein